MSNTTAKQTQPPIQATPTFRKFTVADENGVQSMTIYTSQNVILTNDPKGVPDLRAVLNEWELKAGDEVGGQDSGSDWVTVPILDGADVDVTVHADKVLIYKGLCLPGRSLTIVARTVLAKHEKQDDTSALVIDVSGKNPQTAVPKVPIGMGDNQKVEGKPIGAIAKGGSQGSGTLIKKDWGDGPFYLAPDAGSNGGPGWGAPDHPEMRGNPGAPGDQGQPGGTITIVTGLLQGVALNLRANGGDGQDGQDGQDGVKGGPGGPGAPAVWGGNWLISGTDYAASRMGGPAEREETAASAGKAVLVEHAAT